MKKKQFDALHSIFDLVGFFGIIVDFIYISLSCLKFWDHNFAEFKQFYSVF